MLREFGLDYGTKPRLFLLADISFSEYFTKGKCVGIIYVHCPNTLGNEITTELGFHFEVEEFADKFMDCLMRWVKDSGDDGDAVELEFIEQLNGEYLLAIAPNIERLLHRMVSPDMADRINPLFTTVTQGKGGMSMGKNYEDFKKQYAKGRRIPVRTYIGENGKIQKISDRYFVKTEFKFNKEGSLPNDSLGKALLAKRNKPFNPKNFKSKKTVSIEPIEKRRLEELHYFYPVLLDKIENENWLSEVIASIPPHISRPEILQAISNIVLMERLKQSNPYEVKTDGRGYDLNLLQHLLKTVETYNSYFPNASFFTKSLIKKQAKLDKQYLTDYLQKT